MRTTPVAGLDRHHDEGRAEPARPGRRAHGDEAVRTVTWTANPGTRIGPGEFLDFPLSSARCPTGVDEMVLPAVQTYDDGEVVAWDQPMNADGSEPERPARPSPSTPAAGGEHDAGTPCRAPRSSRRRGADTDGTADRTARWLAGAGLLVGALGLGVGGGAVLRSRRRPSRRGTRAEAPDREHSGAGR